LDAWDEKGLWRENERDAHERDALEAFAFALVEVWDKGKGSGA